MQHYETLVYKLAGSIPRNEGEDLKNWIENYLLIKMHATNCFRAGTMQTLPPDQGQATSLHKFEYTLSFASPVKYRYFRRYLGASFQAEFREKWGYAELIEIYGLTREIDNTARLGA